MTLKRPRKMKQISQNNNSNNNNNNNNKIVLMDKEMNIIQEAVGFKKSGSAHANL